MSALERFGPLIIWGVLFSAGSVIKWLAFGSEAVWNEVPPDACLWAVGMLLAEVIAERDRAGARMNPVIHAKSEGGTAVGYDLRYEITLTGDPRQSPGTFYAALIAMALWIACLVVTQAMGTSPARVDPIPGRIVSYLLALVAVALAIKATINPAPQTLNQVTTK